MIEFNGDEAWVLSDVLRRFAEGHAESAGRPAADYAREFPGHEELIARAAPCMEALAREELARENPGSPESFAALFFARYEDFSHTLSVGGGSVTGAGDFVSGAAAELARWQGAHRKDPEHRDPKHIGPYRVIRRLGDGGMGVVYLAEETGSIRRTLAVKVMKPGVVDEQSEVWFRSERQALALMNHPAIAKVFAVGETAEGQPYFAMEYIEGVSLTEYCDREQLDVEARLRLFQRICEGVQHAHQKGIAHRDIKPSNILVCCPDDEPVVKIIDFGLAKSMNLPLIDQSFHEQGLVGTFAYMSPEQAEAGEVGLLTDVYSLGAVLYELLVGEPPLNEAALRESSLPEKVRAIIEDDPPRPSERWSRLHRERTSRYAEGRAARVSTYRQVLVGDLDNIVQMAIAKEPRRRYQSPRELSEDLGRYLRGQSTAASPPTVVYRLRRFGQRNRVAVRWTAVLTLVLLGGALFAGLGWREAEKQSAELADAEAALLDFATSESIAGLIEEAPRLLPARSQRVAALTDFLDKVDAVLKNEPKHAERLANLRSGRSPQPVDLSSERRELARRRVKLAALRASHASAEEVSVLPRKARSYRLHIRFSCPADHPPPEELLASLEDNAGYLVWLNGTEIVRHNLPKGPVRRDTLAEWLTLQEIAGEVRGRIASDSWPTRGKLRPRRNHLAIELHGASESSELYFALELSTPSGEVLVERQALWDALPASDDSSDWRVAPEPPSDARLLRGPLGRRFFSGKGRAKELERELERDEEALARRESELLASTSPHARYEFSEAEMRWKHKLECQLLLDFERLRKLRAEMQERLDLARTLLTKTVENQRDLWNEVATAFGVQPVEGLVPLEENPEGLWEFLLLESGDLPPRGVEGQYVRNRHGSLIVEAGTGLIFVLVPGGLTRIGMDDPGRPADGPPQTIELAPFFISKYEVTQAQWLRLTGKNPSLNAPPKLLNSQVAREYLAAQTLVNPVEQIDWFTAQAALRRWGLDHPTEAQWECAARAGTATDYPRGATQPEDLEDIGNFRDRSLGGSWHFDFDDRFPVHAPVGRFPPNDYGLHDTLGNVHEWCRDLYQPRLEGERIDGTGELVASDPWTDQRVRRGGRFNSTEFEHYRYAVRAAKTGRHIADSLGLRPVVITEAIREE